MSLDDSYKLNSYKKKCVSKIISMKVDITGNLTMNTVTLKSRWGSPPPIFLIESWDLQMKTRQVTNGRTRYKGPSITHHPLVLKVIWGNFGESKAGLMALTLIFSSKMYILSPSLKRWARSFALSMGCRWKFQHSFLITIKTVGRPMRSPHHLFLSLWLHRCLFLQCNGS